MPAPDTLPGFADWKNGPGSSSKGAAVKGSGLFIFGVARC